jgi:hypothetical protein
MNIGPKMDSWELGKQPSFCDDRIVETELVYLTSLSIYHRPGQNRRTSAKRDTYIIHGVWTGSSLTSVASYEGTNVLRCPNSLKLFSGRLFTSQRTRCARQLSQAAMLASKSHLEWFAHGTFRTYPGSSSISWHLRKVFTGTEFAWVAWHSSNRSRTRCVQYHW